MKPYIQVTVWPFVESWDNTWPAELKAVYAPFVVEVRR